MPNSPCDRGRDTVCIDTYRVLDSCRDKDCFEDVRVYLTCYGQEIIDRTLQLRAYQSEPTPQEIMELIPMLSIRQEILTNSLP